MCRSFIFDKYQYDAKFTLAQDYLLFANILTTHKGANLPDVLVHYRRHAGNTHKVKKDIHLSFIKKIHIYLSESFVVENPSYDLDMFLLLSDSNPKRLNTNDITRIDKWLSKFSQVSLRNNVLDEKQLKYILSLVWKECYWKVEMKALRSYINAIVRNSSWKLFSMAEVKYILKKSVFSNID